MTKPVYYVIAEERVFGVPDPVAKAKREQYIAAGYKVLSTDPDIMGNIMWLIEFENDDAAAVFKLTYL